MNYYLDIQIKPDAEMRENLLLNKVYIKFHKAIFDLSAKDVGINFPQVNARLGCVIRIHSTKNRLNELQNLNWLGGLSGYCKVSKILPMPERVKGYQTISRIRQNMSLSRLQKKIAHQKSQGYLKTDNEIKTYEKQYKAKMFKTGLDNPYLELQSTSTANKYRLYIEFGALQAKPVAGEFNRFGLSNVATVPIF